MAPQPIVPAKMSMCKLFDDTRLAVVHVDGEEVEVEIDPEHGPKLLRLDGSTGSPNDTQRMPCCPPSDRPRWGQGGNSKPWKYWTATEREIAVYVAAKKNKRFREWQAEGVRFPDCSGMSSSAFG
mmetsp:Transcript_62789/g.112711  ORF Transcript_62789/g.112711 Transcript_62789/m.112711 type:complete len:125 (-) Transcript_62789:83-457(-)